MYGSTDVADVSWNVQLPSNNRNCSYRDTVTYVANGCTRQKYGGTKGMSRAARVLARSAIYVLEHPEKLKDIEQEFDREIGRDQYQSHYLKRLNLLYITWNKRELE